MKSSKYSNSNILKHFPVKFHYLLKARTIFIKTVRRKLFNPPCKKNSLYFAFAHKLQTRIDHFLFQKMIHTQGNLISSLFSFNVCRQSFSFSKKYLYKGKRVEMISYPFIMTCSYYHSGN